MNKAKVKNMQTNEEEKRKRESQKKEKKKKKKHCMYTSFMTICYKKEVVSFPWVLQEVFSIAVSLAVSFWLQKLVDVFDILYICDTFVYIIMFFILLSVCMVYTNIVECLTTCSI